MSHQTHLTISNSWIPISPFMSYLLILWSFPDPFQMLISQRNYSVDEAKLTTKEETKANTTVVCIIT